MAAQILRIRVVKILQLVAILLAVENQNFSVWSWWNSVALDPAVVTDGESFTVTANIYETLVNFGERDVTIQPGLAKSWEASEDGLTYTFGYKKV